MRGRKGGGARYFVNIEQKDGNHDRVLLWERAKPMMLLEQLPQAVKRYQIKGFP